MAGELSVKLQRDIKRFLEVYRILSPEGRAQFEAQMAGGIKDHDEQSRKLFQVLLRATKDGRTIEQAIVEMNKANAKLVGS